MKKGKILLVIQIILGLLLLFSIYKIVIWSIENSKTEKNLEIIEKYVKEVEVYEDDETKTILDIDFNALKNINSDTVGYLKVDNTNIQYPVVKTNDNDYYLTKSFDKTSNDAGWIFADYKNNIDGYDKNLVIYGHARKDDSMFGSLSDLLSSDWYSDINNNFITFVTENYYYTYEIFSVYTIPSENYYITTNFVDNEFSDFIDIIEKRSIHDFETLVTSDDNLLTLSTCYQGDDDRIAVHAKLISLEYIN